MNQLNNSNLEALKQQFAQNPLFNRAEEMARNKTPNELEQIAKNLCVQSGINYEEAWKAFQSHFKF